MCAKTVGDRHGHNRTNRIAWTDVHMNRKVTLRYTVQLLYHSPLLWLCVQRVLLSVTNEVEEAQLPAVEVMSGLPSFHCVVHSNMCGCVLLYCCGAIITVNILYLQDGATPLYMASQEGHLPVVECLIGAKADVNHHKKVSRLYTEKLSKTTIANYHCKNNYACLNRRWWRWM